MAFQSTIRFDQTSGIVGEIIKDGPHRAKPVILSSTSAANNVVGRAFRHVSGQDLDVSADAAGVFAGILIHPKAYATSGPSTGALDPTLTLPNEISVEVLDMGFILVDLSLTAPANPSRAIGADIWYRDADGVLVGSTGAGPGAGYTQVPNATIVDRNLADGDPGLAIIKLTN